MRVINDRQQTSEQPDQGFFAVAFFASLSAFSIASVILGPAPMILAHARLQDPWAKVSAVLGAMAALTLLEVPLPVVLFTFILGLFVADRVANDEGFWAALRGTSLLAVLMAIVSLTLVAQAKKVSLGVAWLGQVDQVVAQLKEVFKPQTSVSWDLVRGALVDAGAFVYLFGIILSFWLSVGLAAHLGWLPAEHGFSATSLRRLRLPSWLGVLFVALYIAASVTGGLPQHLLIGLFCLMTGLLFIQGCVTLSLAMQARGWTPRARSIAYVAGITFGFYALVGLGALSPWWLRKQRSLEEVT